MSSTPSSRASGVPSGVDSPEEFKPPKMCRFRAEEGKFVSSVMGESLISSARSNVISEAGRSCDVMAEAGGEVVKRLQRCSVACLPPRGTVIWPLVTIWPSTTGVMSIYQY